MVVYKLFRIKSDGSPGTLFINRGQDLPIGVWLEAEDHPTKSFAHRPGWHCCFQLVAPHLKLKLKSDEIRRWWVVEIENTTTYNRPESQGGSWVLAERMKILHPLTE